MILVYCSCLLYYCSLIPQCGSLWFLTWFIITECKLFSICVCFHVGLQISMSPGNHILHTCKATTTMCSHVCLHDVHLWCLINTHCTFVWSLTCVFSCVYTDLQHFLLYNYTLITCKVSHLRVLMCFCRSPAHVVL